MSTSAASRTVLIEGSNHAGRARIAANAGRGGLVSASWVRRRGAPRLPGLFLVLRVRDTGDMRGMTGPVTWATPTLSAIT